jgi:uncharacterized protein
MPARTQHVCPICGSNSAPRSENSSFPFCTRPCKLVDLSRWLDGTYRFPGPPLESVETLESMGEASIGRAHEEDE